MEYNNTLDTMTPEEAEDAVITGSLTEITEYRMKSAADYAFYGFKNLEKIVLPLTKYIGREFIVNTKVTDVTVHQVNEGYSYMAFQGITTLKVVDMYNDGQIGSGNFNGCTALSALILRKASGIMHLADVGAFSRTPIGSGTGYVYVPRNLIGLYQKATNWSAFAGQFRAIQDYTVDGRIDGELDRAKLGL